MKRTPYNKLVRDRIPEIIEASGKRCETRVLSGEECVQMLKVKLREEIAEYEQSGELEELADILEVLRALAAAGGNAPEELEAARARKAKERGGFKERILLVAVEED